MASSEFRILKHTYEQEVKKELEKYQTLRDLDIFVLDNSIRESTVAQLRGHTIENKWKIYNESKRCGFKNMIVASFAHMTRVDDVFIKQLVDQGEDRTGLWGFSELTDEIRKDKTPDTEKVPVGLLKLKEAGLWNVIFELDLGDTTYDFDKFSVDQMCELIKKWIIWCHENLYKDSKIFVSFRDLPDTMEKHSDRMFKFVDFLCQLPEERRLFGLMFEEPRGHSMPEECGTWTKYMRQIMDAYNWKGHLLVHAHEKFGYCDVTALHVLMSGASGIWASVCLEGASIGQASSCVTLMNLVRLGNTKVLERYNCKYLRQAAINVTRITTGADPHAKQPIFGARAVDFVFDLNKEKFHLAEFFGEKAPIRITTMSSAQMIHDRLVNVFGDCEEFTIELATKMKELILDDLRSKRKEEYMSKVGLALLFDRAGGSLNAVMRDCIANDPLQSPHAQNLIKDIRDRWDTWDLREEGQKDEMLQFDSFYNGFMALYFACYRCSDTKRALQALDMDADGFVDWNEFYVYLRWAIHEYPDIKDADELLDVTFRKGIIPAMHDEVVNKAA